MFITHAIRFVNRNLTKYLLFNPFSPTKRPSGVIAVWQLRTIIVYNTCLISTKYQLFHYDDTVTPYNLMVHSYSK